MPRLRRAVRPLGRADADPAAIARWAGDAQIVLLGEASHGTHEFYQWRADLTRELIQRHDFSAVAIEGDWPDAYRVNKYVQGESPDRNADDALSGFVRFPQWMWRNSVVVDFVTWLRNLNRSVSNSQRRVGFYGLDLYSLHASIQAVIGYLESVDPEAARAAKHSYGCFEDYGDDTQTYAWASRQLGDSLCEDAVVKELLKLRAREDELTRVDGRQAEDAFFSAEQNARLARNAEQYYRTMFKGRVASWNLRDRHMAETLDELVGHLHRRGQPAKVVVWAHNSHLGDARATEVSQQGEFNLGQLVRERYEKRSKSIGFTTFAGFVTAASDWDEPAERKRVRPALEGSFEELFHEVGVPNFFLPLGDSASAESEEQMEGALLPAQRLERAIGVIYRPETERWSHYFRANLGEQFDCVIHIDQTKALEPLERTASWDSGEVPETFPSGI